MTLSDFIALSLNLIAKAVALAARHAGIIRKRELEAIAALSTDEKDKEIALLRDENLQFKLLNKHLLYIRLLSPKIMIYIIH